MNENTDDIEEMLKEYGGIQDRMAELDARKKELRDKISSRLLGHMTGKCKTFDDIDGMSYCVTCSENAVLSYDEDVLKSCLDPSTYLMTLSVDMTKLKKNIAVAAPLLAPVIHVVGTPDPAKIAKLVSMNVIGEDSVKKAECKTSKLTFAVKKGA